MKYKGAAGQNFTKVRCERYGWQIKTRPTASKLIPFSFPQLAPNRTDAAP